MEYLNSKILGISCFGTTTYVMSKNYGPGKLK